jgi:hypothetical protein
MLSRKSKERQAWPKPKCRLSFTREYALRVDPGQDGCRPAGMQRLYGRKPGAMGVAAAVQDRPARFRAYELHTYAQPFSQSWLGRACGDTFYHQNPPPLGVGSCQHLTKHNSPSLIRIMIGGIRSYPLSSASALPARL